MQLEQARRTRGITQQQLATAMGLRQSTISMYECGRRTPPLPTAKRLADFFGVSVDALFFSTDYTKCGGTPCA